MLTRPGSIPRMAATEARMASRMAHQGRVVGNANAAQPDPVAGAPAVGVDPLAHADLAGGAGEGLGHLEILGPGELEEAGIAPDQGDAGAGGGHDRGLVGGLGAGPGVEGADKGVAAEGLRGLGPPEALAVHGAGDMVLAAPEAVGDRQGGEGAIGGCQRVQYASDHLAGQEGTGGVMHQHRFLRRSVEGGEAGAHGQRARSSPLDDDEARQAGEEGLGGPDPVRRGHDHQLSDASGGEGPGRPVKHGPPAQVAPGFGDAGSRPQAGAGGDDDGREGHVGCLGAPERLSSGGFGGASLRGARNA